MTGKATPKKKRIDDGAWISAFLANLRTTCNVRAACEAAGVNRPHVYQYRDKHPAFKAQWEEAIEEAVELLEYAGRKRAIETSDVLLMFFLKAHRREVYQDRIAMELTVQQIAEKVAAANGLNPDELVKVAERIASGEG